MALDSSLPSLHGLTSADSQPEESVMPPATLKDLMRLFTVFLEHLVPDPSYHQPPSTPIFRGHLTPRLDLVRLKKLLEDASAKLSIQTEPSHSCLFSNDQAEKAELTEGLDVENPICTTPDDFKSFEKRASNPQFTTIVETWDKYAYKYKITESLKTSDGLDEYAGFAFVVRERVDQHSEKAIPYIDVKSEGLRDALRVVLRGVKAISLMEDKPTIERNILFHFLPELESYAGNQDNGPDHESAHADVNLLVGHLQEAYTATSQRVSSMLLHGYITYDLLWALFKPGCYVFTKCFGTEDPRCVIFEAGEEVTEDDETWYNLECRFLDYNGFKFGDSGVFLRVPKFRGSKPIATLAAYPLCHHASHEQVRKDLIERGRQFRDVSGSHIRHCQGSAFFVEKGMMMKVNVDSRVAVDAAFFYKMQPNYSRPSLRSMSERSGGPFLDMHATRAESEQAKEKMRGDGIDPQNLGEADLLIACPTVCCFSFKDKIFVECAVSALRDVEWSPELFDHLQIPDEKKTLLLSMAKTRLGLIPTVPFDDMIDGKGRGLTVLLNGPPGVGKTFTVEATAEHFKLPLYSISAGELVVSHGDSKALEQQLETVFKIANHFKAVLLLDEADAFMEQRTSYQDIHNRLVTVFLRKLEYYQGILFLTSNRGIQFDDAVLSRTHIILKYKDLSREFRRALWSNFLNKARTGKGPAIITEDDLRWLEGLKLNGREIKNVTAIAHALAEANAGQVSYTYLKEASRSRQEFSEEFDKQRFYI